jgi:hypothetical protein
MDGADRFFLVVVLFVFALILVGIALAFVL